MTGLKPIYRGGRLIGFHDINGFPVTLRDGRAGIPQAHAPLVGRDSRTGELVVRGGTPEAVAQLVEIARCAEGQETAVAETKESEAEMIHSKHKDMEKEKEHMPPMMPKEHKAMMGKSGAGKPKGKAKAAGKGRKK